MLRMPNRADEEVCARLLVAQQEEEWTIDDELCRRRPDRGPGRNHFEARDRSRLVTLFVDVEIHELSCLRDAQLLVISDAAKVCLVAVKRTAYSQRLERRQQVVRLFHMQARQHDMHVSEISLHER